jgi:1-acyl-sn-glycerol-3-phosphate acyltransferase
MDPLYGICHYAIDVFADAFFRGETAGVSNLPKSGGFLIASNHASHLDPPLVGVQVPRQMSFFARKTLWKPGIANWWMDGVGCIPVDRDGGSDIHALKRVFKALSEGKVLVLFPEGTRSPTGELQTPKAGVGFIACRTQMPVVPAHIFGTFKALSRNSSLKLGVPVDVVFGAPLMPSQYDDPKDGKERYQKASERIMSRIAALERPSFPVI